MSEAPVEWAISDAPVEYLDAVAAMEARVEGIATGRAAELVWLLEHPPLYTAGTSAQPVDLVDPHRFPVHRSSRGGQFTYHGPGQRVVYVMLDVRRRNGDVRAFVGQLQGWIIDALDRFNVRGETRPGRIGVWVRRPDKGRDAEDKIAAIGIRVRRWVSYHGLALNVEPDLGHFSGIVPCGLRGYGVTSLCDLGLVVGMEEVDVALEAAFTRRFAPVCHVSPPTPPMLAAGAGALSHSPTHSSSRAWISAAALSCCGASGMTGQR
jgi:lipoyl(octanoyl) transferase